MDKALMEETRSPHYTRPWRRYFAKFIDMSIFAFIIAVLASIAIGIVWPEWLEMSRAGTIAFGVFSVAASIPVEAAFISRFGTTFGKFLMGTRVLNVDGAKLSYVNALRRTAKSYVVGLALGLPFVPLLTMSTGYNQLENEGSVYWDRSEKTYVFHDEMSRWKWAAGLFVFVSIFVLNILGIVLSIN